MFGEFKAQVVYTPPNRNYEYYAPSWHFRKGLLNQEVIDDIKDNKRKVLSVGSGEAFLERLLVDRLGIGLDQIVLSDKHPIMPERFKQFLFDMYDAWPELGQEFDYIIFPESVLLDPIMLNSSMNAERLYTALENALKTLKPVGQIRVDSSFPKFDTTPKILEQEFNKNYQEVLFTWSRYLLVIKKV